MPDSSRADIHVHEFPVRVYIEDTDVAGIVYYANYLKYAERARTEMLRELGHSHASMVHEHNIAFGVRRCEADYLRSARLDDELTVRTWLTKVGGATAEVTQLILKGDEEIVKLSVKLACMTLSGQATRIPANIRNALEQYVGR